MPELVTDDHLGGYVPGGDEATWYPALWSWLVRELGIKTVLDVGCGDGVALRYFCDLGCEARGLDGIEFPDKDITTHDFTEGPFDHRVAAQKMMTLLRTDPFEYIDYEFDLCWCCEFVEHVEERYMPNYLETFKLARYVLLTHADPGQAGHHHVNCQTPDYWRGAMAAIGFGFDQGLTLKTRELAGFNPNSYNHYVRSGMFFLRLT